MASSRNYFSLRDDDDAEEEEYEQRAIVSRQTQPARNPSRGDDFQSFDRVKGRNRFSAANIDVSDSEDDMPQKDDEAPENIPYNDLQEEQREPEDFSMSQKQEPMVRFSGSFLPQQLELSASKMHVMKSLMFDAPKQFDEDFPEAGDYNMESYFPPREQRAVRKPWDGKPDYSRSPVQQVPRTMIETSHAVPINKIALNTLDLQKSKIKNMSSCVADAGLFLGRSFRVGWGPNGLIAHRGSRQSSNAEHSKSLSVLAIEKVSIDPTFQSIDVVGSKKVFKSLLEEHQKNSQLLESGEEAGTFSLKNVETMVKSYIETSSLAESSSESSKDFQENFALVWRLVDALWGDMQNSDPSDYEEEKRRRSRLSSWIESAVAATVLTETKQFTATLETIFSFLTGRQIQNACTKALSNKDFRLATLIAQAGSNDLRQLINQQIQEWESNGTIQFIEEDRIRILRVLSGNIKEYVINSESLARDWKRCFGMILWYVTPLNSEIGVSLQEFEDSVRHPSGSIYPPAPKYFNGSSVEEVSEFQDVNYHLLHLYVDQSYPMERVLHPRSFTSQPLDYHLSWHLYTVLKAFCFPKLTEKLLYSLHINYAYQLEFLGLWEWSIYILLHLPSQTNREEEIKSRAIKYFLSRNAHLITDDIKAFLTNVLKVPSPWIEEVLSWSAHTSHDTHQEIKYLFGAGDWNSIHKILLSSVAPQAILDDSLEKLRKYFKDLEPHSSTIEGWSKGGKQFLDYISLCSFISSLKKERESVKDYSYQPQKYRQLLQMDSLASQILQWLVDKPCSSDIQRVSVSDMTTQVYQYKKWFKQMISDLNPSHNTSSSAPSHMLLDGEPHSSLAVSSLSSVASIYGEVNELSMLSIPENYRLSLINSMTTDYLSFISSN